MRREPRDLGGCVMSREDVRSVRKECVSIEWSLRNEWMVGGGSGVGLIESLVKTGKWSDGEQWVEESDGAREESEEVMTKSRMWFLSWVGKVTCWLRMTPSTFRLIVFNTCFQLSSPEVISWIKSLQLTIYFHISSYRPYACGLAPWWTYCVSVSGWNGCQKCVMLW